MTPVLDFLYGHGRDQDFEHLFLSEVS